MEKTYMRPHRIRKYIVISLSVAIILLGIIVMIGWYTGHQMITQTSQYYSPMQFNSALCLFIFGIGILLSIHQKHTGARVLGMIAGLFALVTFSQYLLGIDLGIDELLIRDYIEVQTSQPGRMAPNTAISYILAGIYFCTLPVVNRRKFLLSGVISVPIVALASVALFGYITKIEPAYGWGELTRMAVLSAIGNIIFGTALLIHSYDQYKGHRKNVQPIWVAMIVGIGTLTLSIALWQAFMQEFLELQIISGLPMFLLLFGIILSLMLAISVFYAVTAYQRENELKKSYQSLEHRVEERTSQLKVANESLIEKNRELDNFIYFVTHNLKTPIANLRALLSVMYEEANLDLNGDIKELTDRIDQSFNRIDQTIKSLAQTAKAKQNLYEDIEEIDVEHLLHEVMLDNEIMIKNLDAKVDCNCLLVKHIIFSREGLKSIIHNLITNALKYHYPGRQPQIEVQTEAVGQYIQLTVKDNGLGIDLNKYGSVIFGFSKRIHQTAEGSGLGLYYVKTLLEKTGGKIEVESEPEKGTAFHIFLPVLQSKQITKMPEKATV